MTHSHKKRPYLFILIVSSWLFLFPVFLISYKIDPVNSACLVLLVNGLLIGFERSRNMLKKAKDHWADELCAETARKEKFEEELKRLVSTEDQTRGKELATASLYEITKKMSGSLKLDDIVNIFSTFLKENFVFRRSELVILKAASGELRVGRTYQIWKEEAQAVLPESGIDYDEAIKFFTENRKEAYLTRERDRDILERLNLKAGPETFILIPLLSEKGLVGILLIQDLPLVYFERVIILAMQFSLEIKKVLLYEEVEELAITDGLTGLYVRRYFFERLDEEAARSKRYKLKFAFLMFDIDDFKNCNDTHGHLVGDVVLKEVARIIKQSVREIDLVARYGGEEFSVVLTETEKDSAKLVAERIRKRIEGNLFKAYDEQSNLTVSIGLSAYPDDSDKIKELVEKADKVLYQAKAAGKNIVCVCEK